MLTFHELYLRLLQASLKNKTSEQLEELKKFEYDSRQLDCLLSPEKHALVWHIKDCSCTPSESSCVGTCLFDAISKDKNGAISINKDLCVGCSQCIDSCRAKSLASSKDSLAVLECLNSKKFPIYILIAPAFLGQFSASVTPGKLRTAFKKLGFNGMIEVALFADILTLKEALEFNKNIKAKGDYQLTSCCCPMWIAMIKKIYSSLIPHVPPSVSPMVACGRAIKFLYPEATTIFVGPCIAKKSEAREADLKGAVDYVLTFQEVKDIFEFAGIEPDEMEESEKDHSSRAGRIYAKTGGVSEAVESTLERINPSHEKIISQQANGVSSCKAMINELLEGKINANFLEGMGCIGGCVGGPKVLIPTEEGTKNVTMYADNALYNTPIDNPYVIELLHRLNFDTLESLIENSDIFTRNFSLK